MAQGQQEIIKLRDAGFTLEEIAQWKADRTKMLLDAGFSHKEVDDYFGVKQFDPKPLVQYMQQNLKAAEGEGQLGAKPQPKQARGFVEALEAGFQMSVTGLLKREKMPDKTLAQDATFLERMAYSIGNIGGDVPAMVGGFLLGGGAGAATGPGALVTGAGGAMALPMGLRAVITHAYEKGEVRDVKEFFSLAADATIETAKGWVLGAATAGAGQVARAALPTTAPRIVSATVPTTAEIGTMVALGAALEGHVPTAQDFIDAAALIGGMKASAKVASKLRNIYVRTGVPPQEVARQAQHDVTIKQELLSRDVEMPKAFEKLDEAPTPLTPGKVEPKVDPKLLETLPVLGEAGKVEPVFPESVVQEIVFHGTNARFDRFDVTKSKDAGIWFTPVEGAAKMYGDNIRAARVNLRNPYEATVGESRPDALMRAVENGHDGIIVRDKDGSISTLAVFDASQIKEVSRSAPSVTVTLPAVRQPQAPTKPPAPPAQPPKPPQPPALPGKGPSPDPQAAILDRIGTNEKGSRLPTWDDVYTAVVDDLHPIKQFEKAMRGDKDIDSVVGPYELARLTRGAYGMADHFLEYGTFNFNTRDITGKSLKDVLKPVEKDLDGFRAYAVAERAIELEKRGIQTGVPMVDAQAVVNAGRGKYGQVLKELQDYQTELVTYLRDAGVISPEQFSAMLEANKNYVPFYRLAGDEFGAPGTAGRGFAVRNPIKGIKGSESKIVDPIESIIKNTYLYITIAERNNVGRAMHRLVRENPDAAAALGVEVVKTPVRPIQITAKETGADMVAQFLREHGIDVQLADTITVFRGQRQPVGPDQIRFFENGKPVTLRVPEAVAQAMKGMDHHSFSLLTKILALPAKGLRAGTVLSPEFMARNFTRDQLSAFINSVSGFRPIWDTLSGFGSLMKKDQEYQRLLRSGGANAAFVSIDRQYIQNHIFKLSQETGLLRSTWNVVRSPLELLRVLSETIENSTRLGEFKRVTAKGGNLRKGGMAAREVVLDFQRVGAQMRALNMVSAFLNPSIQGMDKIVRVFKDRPVETTVKVLAGVTLPSVLLWVVNHDDPRWKEIPQWQKDVFWIVMTDDAIHRLPKPQELGLLFGTIPERILEAYFTENPDAFKEFRQSVLEGMVPNYLPTFAQPIIEHFANRSTFTGNPIVPSDIEGLLPEYRYTEYTHEVTKMLGSAIAAFPGMKHADAASPAVIENYWRAWTGGLGMYLLDAADRALVAAGVAPDPVKPAATLADLPIIKAFVVRYPSAQAQSIQSFYDKYYERKQVYDTVLALARDGNIEAMRKEYALAPGAMANLDGMREALTNLSKMVRLIHKNPEFTPDEKRQLIDSLYMQMILIAREGNKAMEEIDKVMGSGVEETPSR